MRKELEKKSENERKRDGKRQRDRKGQKKRQKELIIYDDIYGKSKPFLYKPFYKTYKTDQI